MAPIDVEVLDWAAVPIQSISIVRIKLLYRYGMEACSSACVAFYYYYYTGMNEWPAGGMLFGVSGLLLLFIIMNE